MLNAVEGCSAPDTTNRANVKCNHIRTKFIKGTRKASAEGTIPGGVDGSALNDMSNMWIGTDGSAWATTRKIAFNTFNLGQDAGKYLRATPTCSNGAGNCDGKSHAGIGTSYIVPGEGINYLGNYAKTSWAFSSAGNAGTDRWGFSILPAGFLSKGTTTALNSLSQGRGWYAAFLTSTFMTNKTQYADAVTSTPAYTVLQAGFHKYAPVVRVFSYNRNDVMMAYNWISGPQPTMSAVAGNQTSTSKDVVLTTTSVQYMENTAPLVNSYSIRCIKVGALK
jgi:hypothetical protein